jgi:acetoacetate decarboxylase
MPKAAISWLLRNVLIEKCYYEVRDEKGYLAFQMHDTTKDGWFLTQGKMIHVTWKKEGDYKPTTFYDDNGKEITLNTGKTMWFVIQDDKTFTVDGKTYNEGSTNTKTGV